MSIPTCADFFSKLLEKGGHGLHEPSRLPKKSTRWSKLSEPTASRIPERHSVLSLWRMSQPRSIFPPRGASSGRRKSVV